LTSLQAAFAKISDLGIRYSALPGHTTEIADALNQVLSAKWKDLRGLQIVSFGVSSVKASDEDEKMIKELQRSAAFRDPTLAAANLTAAQADAMKLAAQNSGGMGAAFGFMGMNMAQQAGGMNAQQLYNMGRPQGGGPGPGMPGGAPQGGAPAPQGGLRYGGRWCGGRLGLCLWPEKITRANSAAPAGKPKPEAVQGWTCPKCGAVNQGKFCQQCGTPKPAGEPLYKCDKCGWLPPDPHHPPKFCPQCGDPFDDNDVQK
jgi:membrane protease subunit (stomatin/prohibitin family)